MIDGIPGIHYWYQLKAPRCANSACTANLYFLVCCSALEPGTFSESSCNVGTAKINDTSGASSGFHGTKKFGFS